MVAGKKVPMRDQARIQAQIQAIWMRPIPRKIPGRIPGKIPAKIMYYSSEGNLISSTDYGRPERK